MILFAAVIVSLLNMLSHCCCVGGEKHNHKGPQTRGRINGDVTARFSVSFDTLITALDNSTMCEGRIMQCLEVTAARSIICWLQYCSCDTACRAHDAHATFIIPAREFGN